MIAQSDNLISWRRIGPIVTGENNKDHLLFPRKFRGRFAAFLRPWPNIWIAYSNDLKSWPQNDMAIVMGPRPENDWDSASVGSNGLPIETEKGWLHFYHGYDEDHVYCLGVCLLDREDPTQIIGRPKEPIFEPEELWELKGDVNHVVFSNANPVVQGTVYVYYGGGDHVIGLATCQLEDALQYAMHG